MAKNGSNNLSSYFGCAALFFGWLYSFAFYASRLYDISVFRNILPGMRNDPLGYRSAARRCISVVKAKRICDFRNYSCRSTLYSLCTEIFQHTFKTVKTKQESNLFIFNCCRTVFCASQFYSCHSTHIKNLLFAEIWFKIWLL